MFGDISSSHSEILSKQHHKFIYTRYEPSQKACAASLGRKREKKMGFLRNRSGVKGRAAILEEDYGNEDRWKPNRKRRIEEIVPMWWFRADSLLKKAEVDWWWRITSATGPETGWDNWEFFPGPTAPGGPMGAHREGIFFLGREKLKTYGPKRWPEGLVRPSGALSLFF